MIYHEFSNGVLLGFPSIILRRDIPNAIPLNRSIAAYLREDRGRNPLPSQSAVRGWQSATDLAKRNDPNLNKLFSHIGSGLLDVCSASFGFPVTPKDCQVDAEAWGNIQSDRDFTVVHNHVRSDWSGVYYVTVGDGRDRGVLELIDPRTVQEPIGPGRFKRPQREITIAPHDGLLVIWPSWMKHVVYPIEGEGERISIAFNARIRFLA